MHEAVTTLYVLVQLLFFFGLAVTCWFLIQKVDLIPLIRAETDGDHRPPIILFYPVLHELETTMRTTFMGMAKADYPRELLRVISIPNEDDAETIESLRRLQSEFAFLEVMPVPPTSDPTWEVVFSSWDHNPKAYWWHVGKRAGDTALPPKKTRQLIWAMYQVAAGAPDALLSYIDADSVIPEDYFEIAARGMQRYDVVQCTNITGNLMKSWATSFYAMDHLCWDATLYKHMTAGGRHPFYVLGKGLFYRFADLLEVGGFQPWLTIEDPEIGMRLWSNGYRLGVAESPLVEEVPATFAQGITQRKRWVAGFFQSLAGPLTHMGMSFTKRMRARLNFVPCLSLTLNPIGLGLAIWCVIGGVRSPEPFLALPFIVLSWVNILLAVVVIGYFEYRAWKMTTPVLITRSARLKYLLRVNPLFLFAYWMWWSIPLVIGLWMFIRDKGLVWERTEKIDANHELIRQTLKAPQRTRALNASSSAPVMSDSAERAPAK